MLIMPGNKTATFTSYIKNSEIDTPPHGDCALRSSFTTENCKSKAANQKLEAEEASPQINNPDNMNNNIQVSDLRRSQSLKSANTNEKNSVLTQNRLNSSRHFKYKSFIQDLSDGTIHLINKNLDDKCYKRVNSHTQQSSYKSLPGGSPVSLRRRFSFASGASPYLESTRRKVTSHDLLQNSGRRILKAVEEGKILAHTCERTRSDGTPLLESTKAHEDFGNQKILQSNEDIISDHSFQEINSDGKCFDSSDNLSTRNLRHFRRESLKEFETPLKVYNRKKSPANIVMISKENLLPALRKSLSVAGDDERGLSHISSSPRTSIPSSPASPFKWQCSSYQAIRNALSSLYNIEDFNMVKIGEGFFSEVFKVVHKGMGKVMVLKRNKHRANRNNMLKEVQLMNTLKHENILKYEGACVADGQLHALVEYINGGSLEQLILQNPQISPKILSETISLNSIQNQNDAILNQRISTPELQHSSSVATEDQPNSLGLDFEDLPWSTRISLAQDISHGLAYLHSKGIFHRDLTSKNILIRMEHQSGENKNDIVLSAVVADFGLAASIPETDNPNDRLPQVGSPYWMSPECLRGQFYGHKSDVFSFGIILCELIARCEADPDILPRTENFGVDYRVFSQSMVDDSCPAEFLKIAFSCVTIDPTSRPEFETLHEQLSALLSVLSMQSGTKGDNLADTTIYKPDKPLLQNSCQNESTPYTDGDVFIFGSSLSNSEHRLPANLAELQDALSPPVEMSPDCSPLAAENQRIEQLPTKPSLSNSSKPVNFNGDSTPQARRFPGRSRRCVTQRDFPKCSPSEYARHHSPSGPMYLFTAAKPKSIQVTPLAIGEEMSRLDPHYIPSPAPGVNPFAMLPRRLTEAGKHGKIFGSKDLFCSCFELSGEINMSRNPSTLTTSISKNDEVTNNEESREMANFEGRPKMLQRKAVSLIQHPSNITDSLELSDHDKIEEEKNIITLGEQLK